MGFGVTDAPLVKEWNGMVVEICLLDKVTVLNNEMTPYFLMPGKNTE